MNLKEFEWWKFNFYNKRLYKVIDKRRVRGVNYGLE